MKNLGISIYPEKSNEEEILRYIDKAYKNGFTRIFSCLLSVTDTKENIIRKFRKINDYAKERNFEIILDVSPRVFNELDISYKDLTFFKETNCDGIRLDMGFTGLEESIMTFNEHDLKIEINMSNNTSYIDTIMDYMPNKNNLIACHNFYPHRYTGLELEYFNECTNKINKYGIRTAAFITSQTDNSFGPWPVTDKLPTLEIHRDLNIKTQMKHFISLINIDDLIISNCYATDEELESLGVLKRDRVEFDIEIEKTITEIERKILLEELHFNRGDISKNLIRSTQSRVKYKGHNFILHNNRDIKRGDVIIESSEYGHYAGELQIALVDMKNSGKSNVVARINEEELFILENIKAWQKFGFREN